MKKGIPNFSGMPHKLIKFPTKEIPVDALLTALNWAAAVLALIQSDGSEENRFMLNHGMIVDSLWCVEGLLEQSIEMLLHSTRSEVTA